jgi:RNA polymerase sigma factor (sigma-70 family)
MFTSPVKRSWPPSAAAVEAAKAGDERVLTEILVSAMPKLVAFYRGMGLSLHDAEDVASDAGESIVRNIGKLRDVKKFEGWFWQVARSRFYDHLRRKRRSPKGSDRDADFDLPDDPVVVAAEHILVRKAFERLSVRDRELLWMRDVLELPYGDMGRRFLSSQGSMRVAVMRARQRLEEVFNELDVVE